jgi:hypothetical protein
MEVVGYLHNSDLLLEDEQGVAVIGGSSYVLSLGDKVLIKDVIDDKAKIYLVQISFASAGHGMFHDDEIQMKFKGCRSSLDQYIQSTTVH